MVIKNFLNPEAPVVSQNPAITPDRKIEETVYVM